MSGRYNNNPDRYFLSIAEAIVIKSTALARNLWDREYTMDWVMSVIDDYGFPAASMITAAKANGFNWITFCTGTGWNKPRRIAADPRSCIYLFDQTTFTGISLSGTAEVITDAKVKQEMWYDELSSSFRDANDESWCVLRFIPQRYNIFIEGCTIHGTFE